MINLYDATHLYSDIFTTHMKSLSDRLVPEKSTPLYSAYYAIKELDNDNLTLEEKEVVKFLKEIFCVNNVE